jgi:hypothetical protein
MEGYDALTDLGNIGGGEEASFEGEDNGHLVLDMLNVKKVSYSWKYVSSSQDMSFIH